MLITCPICRAECTIDNLSVDTVTCPTCGQQLSTRTGSPASQVVIGDTPAAKDETREWHEADVVTAVDIDVLPVRLGRYFIELLIAQGGFAKVYLATDEALGRRLALKIPRLEKFRTPAKLRQFLAEARIAAKLRHPGIVTIFDVGQFANGANYIAMEYVAGQSLSELMHAARIPVPRAVELMIKIAEAVHYAHSQGLVHRDLKPGNILIDERGEPRVVDFGLAVHEASQAQFQGEVAGTPAFMSPEQFRGEVHRLDGRTDIWSLGVLLYQLLTGRRPFNGDVNQLYDEVLNKAPKPPRQIDDRIPRELESVCLKCLSKSVEDRYTTAKDLAEALRSDFLPAPMERTVPVASDSLKLETSIVASRSRLRRTAVVALLSMAVFVCLFAAVTGLTRLDKPEPANLSLDRRARLNDWIPLLDTKVVPLVWDDSHAAHNWNQRLPTRQLSIDSANEAFFTVGRTLASDYSLQCTIDRSNWDEHAGTVGLFLGYQPVVNFEGYHGHRCPVIAIDSDHEDGKILHRLRVEIWDAMDVAGSSVPAMQIVGLASADIPKPGVNSLLEVEVRRGLLTSVKWESVEYPGLIRDSQFPVVAPVGKESRFGVMNCMGAATFSDVRFKLLDAIPQPAKETP